MGEDLDRTVPIGDIAAGFVDGAEQIFARETLRDPHQARTEGRLGAMTLQTFGALEDRFAACRIPLQIRGALTTCSQSLVTFSYFRIASSDSGSR